MIRKLPTNKAVLLIAALFFSLVSYCQLPNFTFTVTPTPQTCLGNGKLGFAVTGIAPGASMSYAVYLLPNTSTPVTTTNQNQVISLAAGNYQVVATQSLAGDHNTQTAMVTIANNIQALTFSLVPTNVRCGNDGKITVNTLTGTPVSYEIIAGPVTRPLQATNVFNNLPLGQYQVRVFDACGEANVVTIQLIAATPLVAIDAPEFIEGELPTCNTIMVGHFFGTVTGNEIFYPLTFTYTVFPPGGGTPTVITQTVATGTNAGNDIYTNIPFYSGQVYNYNLTVKDACNNIFTRNNIVVNQKFDVAVQQDNQNCGDNVFTLVPNRFKPPYTVNFTTVPAGFIPGNYNLQHPTFSATAIYGASGNSVPEGAYVVQITDACNRTITKSFTVSDPDVSPSVAGLVEGCSTTGSISITINGRTLVSVVITSAPPSYSGPLDVSAFIGVTGFLMEGLPLGAYTFSITDSCTDVYVESEVLAVTGSNPDMSIVQRPGCDIGMGSVRITLPNESNVVSAFITQAPSAFLHPLPHNITAMAVGEDIFMNSLPAGTYTFTTTDNCGVPRSKQFVVEGYQIQTNTLTLIPLCNTFNIQLQHTSNGNYVPSYWLQKFNTATNTWGHPGTNAVYPEGTLPSTVNSKILTNNGITINNQFTGQFRILKAFYTYGNGTVSNTRCIQVIHEFEYDGNPVINNAYSFPCASNLTEVAIEAIGVAPLVYRITTKNTSPFIVENGTSSVFTGLEPATYNFMVTDACGNVRNREFTINELEPLAISETGFCENENSTLSVQPFSFLSYEWWEAGAPGTILSTTSSLNFPSFNSATDAGTYYVRIYTSNASSCMNQTLPPFTVQPNNLPNAGADNLNVSICSESNVINLNDYLVAPFDAGGTWQDTSGSGQLSGNMLNTNGLAAGSYNFQYTVTADCSLTDSAIISVTIKQRPQAPVITPFGNICELDDVQFSVQAVPGATYSWTGPNNFTSSLQNPALADIALQASGVYQVTATVNGCTSLPSQVSINVSQRPNITITGNSQLCAGQSSVLTATITSAHGANIPLGWYLDDVQLPGEFGLSINISEVGDYKFMMSSAGCIGEATFTVTAGSIDEAVVLDGGCDDNEDYVLYVVNTADFPGATFTWDGPGGFTATGSEAVITGLATGDYSVTVNMDGCQKNQPLTVLNTYCKIPKGISPNGDEYNNAFDLSNFDVRDLKIFNRFGMSVYEKENYKDEWHGQSYLGELPTGTYYYVLSLGSGKRVTGWVYLQRQM